MSGPVAHDDVVALYLETGSMDRTAALMGCAKSTVHRVVTRAGVPKAARSSRPERVRCSACDVDMLAPADDGLCGFCREEAGA